MVLLQPAYLGQQSARHTYLSAVLLHSSLSLTRCSLGRSAPPPRRRLAICVPFLSYSFGAQSLVRRQSRA
ncbi:unnamed protein product, partial [Staurois parvus]